MGDFEKALRAQYEQQAQSQFKPGQLGHGVQSAPTPDYLGRAPATPEQIRRAMEEQQALPHQQDIYPAGQENDQKHSQRGQRPKYNNKPRLKGYRVR